MSKISEKPKVIKRLRDRSMAILTTNKQYSEAIPDDLVKLRMQQSHRAKKAPKPTLPKMPWD